jgi:cytochrome c-type protein NapB
MTQRRSVQVFVVVAVVAAAAGLVSGVRGTGRDVRSFIAARPPVRAAAETRSYRDMREAMHGPNAELQAVWWRALPQPNLFAPVVQSEADRDAALARRAARRAYDGAPPTIPHAIDQIAAPSCLTCHELGARIANLIAPRISHPVLGSCVQCHVVAADPRPGVVTPPAPASDFAGLPAPRSGARAWPGAPPTIPHTTWMRDNCASCHGAFGRDGIKSTHPWRASCTQCHAPSAQLDQRAPVAAAGAGR